MTLQSILNMSLQVIRSSQIVKYLNKMENFAEPIWNRTNIEDRIKLIL